MPADPEAQASLGAIGIASAIGPYHLNPIQWRTAFVSMGDPTPGPALTRVETWEYQPLPDEGGAYVPRLEEADVATRDTESPGVFHGFLGRKALIPRARQTAEDVCSALRVAFEV